MALFPDDAACAEHLIRKRWPDGFRCPACACVKGWRLATKPWTYECAGCGKQTSATAGTIMHRTHLPLRTWFLAAHLVATHSNGISALQLQAKLGIGSYKTAWFLLHRLRKAMVDPDRGALEGVVEVDESSMPYHAKSDSRRFGTQGRSPVGKLIVLGAVELKDGGKGPGRIRLKAASDFQGATLRAFVESVTVPKSTISTDGNTGYRGLKDREHKERVIGMMPAHVFMPWIHRVFSNLKRWGMGVYHGLRRCYLQAYLDEFAFRWNFRRRYAEAFDVLLGIGMAVGPMSLKALREAYKNPLPRQQP